jgi:hypothetical protein
MWSASGARASAVLGGAFGMRSLLLGQQCLA